VTLSTAATRFVVVGTSGAGKTTFARQLAAVLSLPHIEMDALYWDPDWTPASDESFRRRVEDALAQPGWVVDGNYRRVSDLTWGRAQALIWLDYPLPRIMAQVFRRTLARAIRGTELWNGNRESLRMSFLSRDSILLWALTSYARHRREYPRYFAQPEHRHLQVIRFRSPQQAQRYLQTLARLSDAPDRAGR
jgi:adenylate kinase family enzyme